MKLGEWIEFNNAFFAGDLTILALKAGSFKKDNQLFRVTVSNDIAKVIFGEHEIKMFRTAKYQNSDFYGIEVVIWIDLDTLVQNGELKES